MKFVQGTLVLTLAAILTACGGGSDGYFNNEGTDSSNQNNNSGGTTTPAETANAQLNILKREGQYLFGNYDPNDASTAKGYIDHSMDTFAQGPLQLSLDIRKINLNSFKIPITTEINVSI